MLLRIMQVALGLVVAGGALWLGLVVSFRTKFAPVQRAIRHVNRRFTNPRQLRTAGQPGASASVVRHVGRTSGTAYRTPVVAAELDGGFLVALPYGPGVHWVRNVVAAGSAELEHEGRTIAVEAPVFVSAAEANPNFPAKEQRAHRLYGVDDFLHLPRRSVDGEARP